MTITELKCKLIQYLIYKSNEAVCFLKTSGHPKTVRKYLEFKH